MLILLIQISKGKELLWEDWVVSNNVNEDLKVGGEEVDLQQHQERCVYYTCSLTELF